MNATSERNEVKMFESLLQTTIRQAFTALILFLGNGRWAEEALLQALRISDSIGEEPASFAIRAIELAIRMSENNVLAWEEQEETSLELPPELQRIFEMSANLRHCFVLRVLLGVGAGPCAAILGRQINVVHESTSAALLSLADLKPHITGGPMKFQTESP